MTNSATNFSSMSAVYTWSHPSVTLPDVTSIKSVSLVRQGDKYLYRMEEINGDQVTNHAYSWDGHMYVRQGQPPDLRPEDDQFLIFVNDRDDEMGTVRNLEKFLGFLDPEDGLWKCDVLSFDASSGIMNIGNSSVEAARIYFTDTQQFEYSKIEYVDFAGTVIGTREARDWVSFDGVHLPSHVRLIGSSGELEQEFHLNEFNNHIEPQLDFVLDIPRLDTQPIYDMRFEVVFTSTQLDERLFSAKEYLNALEQAYTLRQVLPNGAEPLSLDDLFVPAQSIIPDDTVKVAADRSQMGESLVNAVQVQTMPRKNQSGARWLWITVAISATIGSAMLITSIARRRRG